MDSKRAKAMYNCRGDDLRVKVYVKTYIREDATGEVNGGLWEKVDEWTKSDFPPCCVKK